MSFINPFKRKGIWLKGNTHTHTRASDGALTPLEISKEYRRLNYDFVFLTDHRKRTVAPGNLPKKPLLIPGQELDFAYGDHFHHAVCLGLKKEWPLKINKSWDTLRRQMQRDKALLILAHPYWSGNFATLFDDARNLFVGLEVYNTVCDMMIAKGYSSVHWDDMLDAGHRLAGLAADDTHAACHIGRGWIMVKAASRTPAAILGAIRQGAFYATQGPEIIDLTVRGRKVSVRCAPARRINIIGNRASGRSLEDPKAKLTESEWTVPSYANYARVEVVDKEGRMAWTNPVFFK